MPLKYVVDVLPVHFEINLMKIKRAQARNSAILPTVSCFMASGEVGQIGCAL